MKKTTKILSALLACLMLVSLLSVGVFAAAGDQSEPINANDKWFGYGVDCFLMNTTLEAGDADGVWYQLTADAAGILQVEHSVPSEAPVDYQITVNVNGQEYLGYENGLYNTPIATLPVAIGDVISIHIIAQDTAVGGTVYCNAKFISGEYEMTQMVKLKGAGVRVWVANGATVYFQDDSLQADYAAKGLNLVGDTVEGVTVISNTARYTDTDGDAVVELLLGGSAGSAGAPPVKPSFGIENLSGADAWFLLNVTDAAHECVYDDDADADCNTCGAIREVEAPCSHVYDDGCDAECNTCGEVREAPHYTWPCMDYCTICQAGVPITGDHVYVDPFATACDNCGVPREDAPGITFYGSAISQDVNGLAMKFDAIVEGMEKNGNTAVYDNATIGGYKLVGMGAVVWNDGAEEYSVEDVDGVRVLDIPAVYLIDDDVTDGVVSYAVRIINIPDEYKDTVIRFRSYFIYEDEAGQDFVMYGHSAAGAYNWY